MRKFESKVAFVTGGTKGIGRACVLEFAKNGAQVVFCGTSEKSAQETLDLCAAEGLNDIKFIKTNVSEADEVEKAVKYTVSTFGRLDYGLNVAGLCPSKPEELAPIGDYSLDVWKKTIEVNLNGVFYSLKYELKAMEECGNGGAIVNISSFAAFRHAPNIAAYTASKWAVVGLMRNAANEYGPKGIRVNTVAPGSVDTTMVYPEGPEGDAIRESFKARSLMGRLTEPKEIAKMCAYICSDDCPTVTGTHIAVDQGATIGF